MKINERVADAAGTLSGVRSLRPDEISFVHGVSRQDGVLRFTMSDGIAADEVFGVEPGRENDVTVFAAYDLERGAVCDTLDVKMFADDGEKEYRAYVLSAAEKAELLTKMDAYCQERTGMGLESHRERYLLERGGVLPRPDGNRPDALKTERRRKRLETGGGERSPDNHKYEITDIKHPKFPELRRVMALRDIGTEIRAGDLGGYVQNESNLSYEEGDDAWVHDEARICGEARVCENSQIRNRAVVDGHAYVGESSLICGDASVSDGARILGALLRDFAKARGNCLLTKSTRTNIAPTLFGNCEMRGSAEGFVRIGGRGVIPPETAIRNDSPEPTQFEGRNRSGAKRGGRGKRERIR